MQIYVDKGDLKCYDIEDEYSKSGYLYSLRKKVMGMRFSKE
jgi:hypothetical protein